MDNNEKLEKSFVLQVQKYLNNHGVKNTLDKESSLPNAWIELTTFLDKKVSLNERRIYKAIGYEDTVRILPQEYQIKLHKIIEKIKNGEDINSHLTTQIFNSKKFDYLLNNWNIKHLHIEDPTEFNENSMHKNRSKYLLFAVIKKDAAYLLEVKEHPHGAQFTAYHFLEILHQNDWMKLAGFEIMEGITDLQPHIESDDEIYDLYKMRFNMGFTFDCKCYYPIFGVTSHGNKISRSMDIGKIKKIFSNMPSVTKCIDYKENNGKLNFVFNDGIKDFELEVNE